MSRKSEIIQGLTVVAALAAGGVGLIYLMQLTEPCSAMNATLFMLAAISFAASLQVLSDVLFGFPNRK